MTKLIRISGCWCPTVSKDVQSSAKCLGCPQMLGVVLHRICAQEREAYFVRKYAHDALSC